MKRLIPFSTKSSICLLACLVWAAWQPQTASAYYGSDDGHSDGGYGDKGHKQNHDNNSSGCQVDDKQKSDDTGKGDDKNGEDHGKGDDKSKGDDNGKGDDHKNNATIGAFLTVIRNQSSAASSTGASSDPGVWGTGGNNNFASRSVIVLHSDCTMSVIDSNQGGPGVPFSSQLGAWRSSGSDGAMKGTTLDFSFPAAGIARLDYTFNANQPKDMISGTITLTVFPLNADPEHDTGTVVGNFNFTGARVTVP